MRIKTYALKLKQLKDANINIYTTKLSVGQIKALISEKQIITQEYNPDINEDEGYQRKLDPQRSKKILIFLREDYDIVKPVFPTSIVLNSRKLGSLTFKDGELIIGSDADLYVVDGQHRIEGLKNYEIDSYEVPVTIMEGLNQHQEAAQFLIINSTQKAVDPQLQLRVIYYADEEGINKLIDEIKEIIPWQGWKLEALKIAINLENDGNSPWHTLIKRPNEQSQSWKAINEGSFIDSLRFVCSEGNPLEYLDNGKKINSLMLYWDTIKKLYPNGFKKDEADHYLISSSFGAGVFNTLFPSVTTLSFLNQKEYIDILKPLQKKYPLNKWIKKRGELAKKGSGQNVYKDTATEFLLKINSNLDYFNDKEYDKIFKDGRQRGLLKKATNMLSPLYLRYHSFLPKDRGRFAKACYVLANLSDDNISVYVGQTKNVESRLKQHKNRYNLYYIKSCENEKDVDYLEGALYHLVKPEVRENQVHPNAKYCAFCKDE